jgi:hypothetical protein
MRQFVICLGLFSTACLSGELGSRCVIGQDNCVEGTVCTPDESPTEPPEDPNADSATCRQICEIEDDCPDGFDCRRATGSMESVCVPGTPEPATDGGV